MNNWERDGWTESDWDAIVGRSAALQTVARDLDNAIGGGGGGFTPHELSALAEQALAAALRLKEVAARYV